MANPHTLPQGKLNVHSIIKEGRIAAEIAVLQCSSTLANVFQPVLFCMNVVNSVVGEVLVDACRMTGIGKAYCATTLHT